MASAIPCLTWVKRGAAKKTPVKLKLTENEVAELVEKQQKMHLNSSDDEEDDNEGLKHKIPKNTTGPNEDVERRYSLDDYSDEEPDQGDEDEEYEDIEEDAIPAEDLVDKNLAGFYQHVPNDPYLKKNMVDSDEEENDVILENDNLIVVGKVKNEVSNLEVHVYNQRDKNMFCHHDMLLGGFPLCFEWLDFDPTEPATRGNFIALGSMEPDIEIWDLDVAGTMEPAFVLKGVPKGARHKRKKKRFTTGAGGHSDAVLDLSWNKLHREGLASASADGVIGLWDLEEGAMVSRLTSHDDKVQAVEWSPREKTALLSGGFDGKILLHDARMLETARRWAADGEVEKVTWDPGCEFRCFASTDTGRVVACDQRSDKPLWELSAHAGAVTGLCPALDGACLLTSSEDKHLKVWDVVAAPKLVHDRTLRVSQLLCSELCPDHKLLLAVGGAKEFRVLDLWRNDVIRTHFSRNGLGESDDFEGKDDEEVDANNLTDSNDDDADLTTRKPLADNTQTKNKKKKRKRKKKPKSETA